jgi:two-component system chemotaxis sensor kinase CheA
MDTDDKLLKAMQDSFKLEMSERLLAISQHLATLEDTASAEAETGKDKANDKATEIIGALFRELHNLKGAARAVNYPQIEELCHASEGMLARLRSLPEPLEASEFDRVIDLLYQSVSWGDQLLNLLNLAKPLASPELSEFVRLLRQEAEQEESPLPVEKTFEPSETKEKEFQVLDLKETAPVKPRSVGLPKNGASFPAASGDNSVRISGNKLDELLAASTELLVARLRMRQHREEIAKVLGEGQSWLRLWRGVRGSHARLVQKAVSAKKAGQRDNDLNNLLHFVDLNQQYLKQLESNLASLHARFTRDVSYLSFVTDQLQFETRRLRLIPLGIVMEEMERTVRQLSRDLGKQVQLVVHGAELEVDKKLLDEVKAPLLHLLRNALDHGLESPAQRLHKGKPATGTITVSFRQNGNLIELEVRDDGAGLDLTRIKELAIERGLVAAEAAGTLDERSITEFIFQSGFSTRPEVNGISGRGVGMDTVREVATRLGGSLEVSTSSGGGTCFRLSVPNVLVTAEGIVIKSNDQIFVLPIDGMERSFRLSEVEVQTIGARRYLIHDGRQILLVSLAQILGLPALPAGLVQNSNQYAIVLQHHGRYCTFVVDELLKNQEVVVKSFSQPLIRVRRASGATIMANGQVALILNIEELIRAASTLPEMGSSPGQIFPQTGKQTERTLPGLNPAENTRQRILVVDDSITTRTLEKNILEGAGFFVQTADNGVEALGYLRNNAFDLVVTDLEMPEMDGFHLTQAIKQDQRLSELPVIVVTSLDKPEDKARGLEAGADAYVVKSRFDQQGLLATIRQLV